MMMDSQYSWVSFYTEFANRLLAFKSDRGALIDKLRRIYADLGEKRPNLSLGSDAEDTDPFTVFALFTRGRQSAETRRRILKGIARAFDMSSPVPEDFVGIPVMANRLLIFHGYLRSGKHGGSKIDILWDLFESALVYADEPNEANKIKLVDKYDILRYYGMTWRITTGLYWVRPSFYVSLDAATRNYLLIHVDLPESYRGFLKAIGSLPTAAEYLALGEHLHMLARSESSDFNMIPELCGKGLAAIEQTGQQRKGTSTAKIKVAQEQVLGDADVRTVRYWLYAPGELAHMWDEFYARGIMGIGWSELGDLEQYSSKEEMRLCLLELSADDTSQTNSARAVWQFVNEIKPGDIVFAKRGRNEILGRGVVVGGYEYDVDGSQYPHIRKVRWGRKDIWRSERQFVMKTLTEITDYTDFVAQIEAFFEEDEGGEEREVPPISFPEYSAEEFLDEVYMDGQHYDVIVGLLRSKKNLLLQGAPGVGKTFAAKRLAYSMMGLKDASRVMMVQFHQSYSYEDFIEGYRPSAEGFELVKGAFYSFCKKAADDEENDYFFVIDEINRGNLSKIFGELFMLIENDKRGIKLQLLYSRELFYVPRNVHIIGMMNTADRSLAMLDYALRRRFAFVELRPAFGSDGFREYCSGLGNPTFEALVREVESLNRAITEDESLGDGFCIGHSYFCNMKPEDCTDAALASIVDYELIPMLKEYWFDEPTKVREWNDRLRRTLR